MTLDDTLHIDGNAPVGDLEEFFRLAGGDSVPLPQCQDCARFHWYPMGRCPHCQSERLVWRQLDGRATVYAATTVRHAFTERTRGQTPYGLALVTFDEAPEIRMVCRAIGPAPAIGDAVTVRVEHDPASGDIGMIWCRLTDEEDRS
ncbi:hypothetical protein GCM10022237_06100 [Nocardioides ginsengisoli]|uniref:Zn-ribbon domain-containing OB-fold protein n=1 Tax=Nocardioides ginsengisoli TaxID=363868 RepID=A0ABW3VXG4_9ACTN